MTRGPVANAAQVRITAIQAEKRLNGKQTVLQSVRGAVQNDIAALIADPVYWRTKDQGGADAEFLPEVRGGSRCC